MPVVRQTFSMQDDQLVELKAEAARQDRPLSQIVQYACRIGLRELQKMRVPDRREEPRW